MHGGSVGRPSIEVPPFVNTFHSPMHFVPDRKIAVSFARDPLLKRKWWAVGCQDVAWRCLASRPSDDCTEAVLFGKFAGERASEGRVTGQDRVGRHLIRKDSAVSSSAGHAFCPRKWGASVHPADLRPSFAPRSTSTGEQPICPCLRSKRIGISKKSIVSEGSHSGVPGSPLPSRPPLSRKSL